MKFWEGVKVLVFESGLVRVLKMVSNGQTPSIADWVAAGFEAVMVVAAIVAVVLAVCAGAPALVVIGAAVGVVSRRCCTARAEATSAH
jgi:hypothetical protein